MKPLPLAGVRVLSVEQYGAGPYGTMLLADLGAEVVKIEDPARGGDVSRTVGPFFLGDQDSDFFQTFSLGKQSAALDLKSAEGRAAFEALVRGADAVANNLRGDQPAKLGLDYAALAPLNPRIVCAHLSAYGRGGPREDWPGYDYLMQAEAGFLALTGEPDGPPTRFGLSMVDFHTGTQLALALTAGVLGARRTGQGCDVDVSLFDTALHQLSYPAAWRLNRGYSTERLPRSAHPSIAPSQLVRTADGWGFLMCQTERFWALLCQLAEAPGLQADPRFRTNADRRAHLAALTAELDALFGQRTTADWLGALGGQVPFAPVLDLGQALDNPFAADMLEDVPHPDAPNGVLRMLASPFKIDGARPRRTRAPKLGEHGGRA